MVPPGVVVVLTTNGTGARGQLGSRNERRGERRPVARRSRFERVGLDEVDAQPARDRLGAGPAAERADARVLSAEAVAVGLDPAPDRDDAVDPLELAVVRLRSGAVVGVDAAATARMRRGGRLRPPAPAPQPGAGG